MEFMEFETSNNGKVLVNTDAITYVSKVSAGICNLWLFGAGFVQIAEPYEKVAAMLQLDNLAIAKHTPAPAAPSSDIQVTK